MTGAANTRAMTVEPSKGTDDVRGLIERIPAAIKATEYKYFGDYEMSDDQRDAVDVLVRAAAALEASLAREEALQGLIQSVLPSAAGTANQPDARVIRFYITLGEVRAIRKALQEQANEH